MLVALFFHVRMAQKYDYHVEVWVVDLEIIQRSVMTDLIFLHDIIFGNHAKCSFPIAPLSLTQRSSHDVQNVEDACLIQFGLNRQSNIRIYTYL